MKVKCWDLGSNQAVQIAEHQAPVKACRWVKAPNYSALMTVSWDKTMKFWDTRAPTPMLSIDLPERAYCADVEYPMAVVGTAGRGIVIYQLDGQPKEFKKVESPLKYQHRCVSIFKDKKNAPTGFALGSVEGRVAIQYVNAVNPKDNFTFKCHRSTGAVNGFQVMNTITFTLSCHSLNFPSGYLCCERHHLPPRARHPLYCRLRRPLLLLGQGRPHEAEDQRGL